MGADRSRCGKNTGWVQDRGGDGARMGAGQSWCHRHGWDMERVWDRGRVLFWADGICLSKKFSSGIRFSQEQRGKKSEVQDECKSWKLDRKNLCENLLSACDFFVFHSDKLHEMKIKGGKTETAMFDLPHALAGFSKRSFLAAGWNSTKVIPEGILVQESSSS
ncbi:hypothetical protein DUI87_28262 [Hirundo rustica rustica]|uniref:Uncharacterized protein n=1 Tax=Hirundo rustica rustica TaxID=333673 RepID=A0A3M0J3A6_HIRRU|nr:hypothetical protein DUI87_28262 [Hirundo rustica rustica]